MKNLIVFIALTLMSLAASAQATEIQALSVKGGCPAGRLNVQVRWFEDPLQANIRYLRDPGFIVRCFESALSESPPLGSFLVLSQMGPDLRVVRRAEKDEFKRTPIR